jgi:hypothetical protein
MRRQFVEGVRVEQWVDGLDGGDTGRGEDRGHDRVPGPAFTSSADREERDAEWDRGERIADVVDQVREQRDRSRRDEHDRLHRGRDRQDQQAPRDDLDAIARSDDLGIHQAVRVAMVVVVVGGLGRREREPGVTVSAVVVMVVCPEAVTMFERPVHRRSR